MKKYFIHDGKEQKGPFDIEDLKGLKVTKDSMIWYEGIENWTKAKDILEIKEIFPPTPPPFIEQTVKSKPPPKSKSPKNNLLKENSLNTIWICGNCNSEVQGNFDICWNCGADMEGNIDNAVAQDLKEIKKKSTVNDNQVGIILMVVGIAIIIISQTVPFTTTIHENTGFGVSFSHDVELTTLKNIVLFIGIGVLIWGGIKLAMGLNNKES